ncbi:MAG: hypothetical protein RBS80_25735 [Thermoguttaceae bacterium]|jgi:hypothetical protein|nr:hypothetical protein [Thermoguttaceae bacterium]
MNRTEVDIERIIREVLADLGGAPAEAVCSNPAESRPAAADTRSDAPDDAVVLTAQVVTLAHLGATKPAVRRLVVPAGAVVTPAVRDELRRRGATLEYGTVAKPSAGGTCRLAVWNVSKRYDPSPLMTMLRREGTPADLKSSTCLVATTDALAAVIRRGGTVGLILTREPAVALCLANRHAGVRAVVGREARQAAADLAAVGGNVLVVDRTSCTLFQIKQMASELCRGAPRACPEELKERLAQGG